ncbi:MAG: hypothetical protein KGD60_10550 [Candidatus Thorarchaeota archaeon]|nr:hypothetical protein [Candidatus Thorarchaeota archaeon]
MSSLISSIAAVIVIVSFVGLIILQLLLALGKPYGRMTYGGKYEVLPTKYRIMSVFADVIFIVAIFFVLVKVELIAVFPFPVIANLGLWFFAFYLGLNTLANVTSKSQSEKQIMTPISLITCICLFIIALGL